MAQLKGKLAAGGALGAMTISAAGVVFISTWEGGPKLVAYRDIIGIWTICDGITGRIVIDGVDYGLVREGMELTSKQCHVIYRGKLREHEAPLQRCIKAKVTQNQWDALVSMAFNLGPGTVCGGSVARNVNAGDMTAAAQSMLEYNKAAYSVRPKKLDCYWSPKREKWMCVVPGLNNRRVAEVRLFNTPDAWGVFQPSTEDRLKANANLLKDAS